MSYHRHLRSGASAVLILGLLAISGCQIGMPQADTGPMTRQVACGNGLEARLSLQPVNATSANMTYVLRNPGSSAVQATYPNSCTAPGVLINGQQQPSDQMCAQAITTRQIMPGQQQATRQLVPVAGLQQIGIRDIACPVTISLPVSMR